jgi:hypothetical protein
MVKFSALFCLVAFSPIPVLAAGPSSWVPYSAQYKEISTNTYAGGKQQSLTKVGQEVRSVDGSIATFEQINGVIGAGEIWMACGQLAKLNYATKQATLMTRPMRGHMIVPPDPPLGTATIAGLRATGYPIHFPNGQTGSIWIAMDSEIMVKTEYHVQMNGTRFDYFKQLDSVDMNVSDVNNSMKLPAGFSISVASTVSPTCASQLR